MLSTIHTHTQDDVLHIIFGKKLSFMYIIVFRCQKYLEKIVENHADLVQRETVTQTIVGKIEYQI